MQTIVLVVVSDDECTYTEYERGNQLVVRPSESVRAGIRPLPLEASRAYREDDHGQRRDRRRNSDPHYQRHAAHPLSVSDISHPHRVSPYAITDRLGSVRWRSVFEKSGSSRRIGRARCAIARRTASAGAAFVEDRAGAPLVVIRNPRFAFDRDVPTIGKVIERDVCPILDHIPVVVFADHLGGHDLTASGAHSIHDRKAMSGAAAADISADRLRADEALPMCREDVPRASTGRLVGRYEHPPSTKTTMVATIALRSHRRLRRGTGCSITSRGYAERRHVCPIVDARTADRHSPSLAKSGTLSVWIAA